MMFPRVPPQSTDPEWDAITQMFAGGPPVSGYQSLIGSLEGLLGGVDTAPRPGPEPIPGGINPLGAMAAIFASTLGEQMGARGASGAVREQIAQSEMAQAGAAQRNQALERENMRQKRLERINLLEQINDAKLKMAQETGDWAAAEAAAKSSLNLARAKQKEDKEKQLEVVNARTKGAVEVAKVRTEAQNKLADLRLQLQEKAEKDPTFALHLKWAQARWDNAYSEAERMEQENKQAINNFQDPPWPEEAIKEAWFRGDQNAQKIYEEALNRMTGKRGQLPPDNPALDEMPSSVMLRSVSGKTEPTAPKRKAEDFFKK